MKSRNYQENEAMSDLNKKLYSQLYSQLNSQLYSQIDSQLDNQLDSQLDSQLDLVVDNQRKVVYKLLGEKCLHDMGIKSRGKVDFLRKYCSYTSIWVDKFSKLLIRLYK